MRIVQLVTQTRGGPVDHAVEVAAELARRGHHSHLIAPVGIDPALDGRLGAAGVVVHRAGMTGKLDVRGARGILGTLGAIGPDVVHCQDRRAGLVARLAGRLGASRPVLPTVYTLHGVPDPLAALVPGNVAVGRPTRRVRWANLHAERLLAAVERSRVVTPCAALSEYARRHVGIPADRLRIVHNGVADRWVRAGATRPDVRRVPTVAWLGVMQPVKRVPELVRVIADVPDVRLLLIGDGPERPRVEAAIAAAGVGDRVELAGFHTEPEALLARADLLVLPSAAEAFPMALLQAMACGLPVVASRAGGIGELVRDGVDGLLVPTADDAALREALHRLTKDSVLRADLGASARRRVLDGFTVEHGTGRLLGVYEEVVR